MKLKFNNKCIRLMTVYNKIKKILRNQIKKRMKIKSKVFK